MDDLGCEAHLRVMKGDLVRVLTGSEDVDRRNFSQTSTGRLHCGVEMLQALCLDAGAIPVRPPQCLR